ncbi:Mitochondrial distribution and morphology protein 12 [Vermiconidia calcicola]|uniref:Mitochondrial distribution and morphology protein 12 n=1 Tax=Vermiconidia calcicola TaxID=1690605 RepID=A0ACC3MTS0_9PEZI|nr:Mitochondrial distribution and morphology protein 12 [Vermiconidia calcicola]
MAPEPPSPSASSALLPFLGTRPRRDSLASLNSTKGEVDKDVLAQALDSIHTSASKSETLTSFHDYDGGAPRSGAKEIVSSGVTGLFDKLKRGFNVGTPMKEAKGRPKSSASKESVETDSIRSNGFRKSVGLGFGALPDEDASAKSSRSVTASPMLATFTKSGTPLEPALSDSKPRTDMHKVESIVGSISDPLLDSKDSTLGAKPEARAAQDTPTQADIYRARSAPVEDQSDTAREALGRVLTHQDTQIGGKAKQPRSLHIGDGDEEAPGGNEAVREAVRSPSAPPAIARHSTLSFQEAGRPSERSLYKDDGARPPLLKVGESHLPGYEPSRASSTVRGDAASVNSTRSPSKKPRLEPSPNLNIAIPRRRIDMKPPPRPAGSVHHVPTHLKRRVISKTFWMKDENAKDCFYCGQAFSTFRRKHHCRTCGQIFDAKCTNLVPGRPFGQPGTIRLCKPCEAMIYGSDDENSTVFSDDASEFARSPIARGSFGEGDDIPGIQHGVGDDDGHNAVLTTPSIGIPASRRNREAKRRSAIIEFDAAPTLARPTSSHSLISLARRPRSSSHRRHYSRHQAIRGVRMPVDERGPFQPGSTEDPEKKSALPAFHNDNIIDPDLAAFLSDDGSDEEGQQSIFATLGDVNSPSPENRDRIGYAGMVPSAKKIGRSRLGPMSSVKVTTEDEPLNHAKNLKLSRNRNPSIGTVVRLSPRRSRSHNLTNLAADSESFERKHASPFVARSGARTKLIRSSAMQGRDAPPIELNHASLAHVRKLLSQLLRDSNIEPTSAWEKALVPMLLQCTDVVEPNVQLGDDMDIRHYIKLKKVPGGRPGDTSYISGIVFSKNVALKCMARSISNPRIAIVTFAIEYARHQTHFMSLEPVIAQEREYLRNLVARIAALCPQLLLVQRNVSGLAVDLLEEAGITVAYNIKESVLAAVARVTQTTMIKSVDKLAIDPSHLGHCDSFEVKTFVHDGLRKNYIYLSGCQPELGCTIVLRGADTRMLRKIKRITEFMCYVAYNLKLETNLLRDQFAAIPSATDGHFEAPGSARLMNQDGHDLKMGPGFEHGESTDDSSTRVASDNEPPSEYEKLEIDCKSRILSASPFVVFMQPYLLTQLRESEKRLTTYKKLRDQYAAADEEGDQDEKTLNKHFEVVRPEMVHVPASSRQPKAVREYLHAVHQAQLDKTMHTYETQRRLMDSFMSGSSSPFDPFAHQTIVVLHSTVSTINSAPCIGPEVLGIGFYAGYNHVEPQFEEDCTLGQYIEDLCVSANSTCKECGKRTYDHHRQYVHGYGQLSISVSRQPAKLRGYERTILMWSTCRICKQETTILPMSDNTWKYSFAKYLELSFWSSPLHPRAGVCQHDIHKDFYRCFGFEDLAVRVQYDSVEIYDVVVPRSTITWKVESDLTVKNEQFSHFVSRLNAFTDSIKKRLASINVDTLDEKKSMEANELVDDLRRRAENDHEELLVKLQQKYAVSRYYEVIPLNRALRFMDEKALSWDDIFSNFERDYFPSETDIRKLATVQLKNMFLESQPATSTVVSDASDDDEGTATKAVVSRGLRSRVPHHELRSEKAHDVLSSTVEEHRAAIADEGEVGVIIKDESEDQLCSNLSRTVSPREEQEQAVGRQDVKHLDLAVPAHSPEEHFIDERPGSEHPSPQLSRPGTRNGGTGEEPFATTLVTPMSSGLLERIEQIRSNRSDGPTEQEQAESKIPRLADLKKREASPKPALLRAQSSPSSPVHRARKSADMSSEHSIDSVANGTNENHPAEKRLGERLGVSRLANKVGKVAPSLIPRSIPSKSDEAHHTKVSALAKHFEQMSREFEKERLKERRQRALRSRQARANPLASSRPVVEVYRNATDAVGERTVDQAKAEHGVQEPKSDQAPPNETAAQIPLPNSDDSQLGDSPTQPATGGQTQADSDADGEDEVSDVEPARSRLRVVSDPNSALSSSGIISPSTVPDIELHPELSIPEHRKSVWFNYLTEFWSKRSASGWAPLEYPLHGTEHVFEDSDIIVREDEPSSVIALSLACADYQVKVQGFRSHPKKHAKQSNSQSNIGSVDANTQQNAIEASLLSDTGTHMKYSFAHGSVKASCKIFYAEAFDALRRRCGVSERFVESLSRCLKFDSKGGKTKSLFLKTLDNRLYIKSLQEVELKAFTKFAPDYFAFMSHTLFHGVPSVIAKMFGLFQVIIKNPATGMDFSYHLLVMENLFYERNPNRRFDLKGSMRNRKIETTGQPDEVLLDENLVETIFESPLFVREHARKLLQASVWNDTMWLCKQNVMDYSLMAGFDDQRKELIVGIIDCIRTYTWDKKLESWIKDRGKNKPTITSPKDYRNRFRVSMMQYVLQSPGPWSYLMGQMSAPKTLKEEREDNAETTETEREGEARRSVAT